MESDLPAETGCFVAGQAHNRASILFPFRTKNAVLKVLVDGETVIKETRPSDPGDSGRFIISSSVGSESKSFKNDEIVRLYHLRFRAISKDGSSSVPKNPRPGILLWIEAVDNAEEVAEKN